MKRLVISTILIGLIIAIGITVVVEDKHPPLDSSLETLFTMLGKPIKTLDRSFTKAIGVNVEDERALGDILANEMQSWSIKNHPAQPYLNDLITEMAKHYNPKNLHFRIFVVEGSPNAFALPGGIIAVTTGLLKMLETEAQLVAILGHEKGHVDLGHCIDGMRMEAKKRDPNSGSFIEYFMKALWRMNFSKTQEAESDQYGFETLISLSYAPEGMGQSFEQLFKTYPYETKGILIDYFKTHPSTQIRAENWMQTAQRWRNRHPNTKMYQGKRNYKDFEAKTVKPYAEEWQ